MKLYHGGKIISGLLIFIIILTFPFWYRAVSGKSPVPFDPTTSKSEGNCIESRDYMRNQHMQLLYDWREMVVREGKRVYVATDGQTYTISLTKTCMKCHGYENGDEKISNAMYCIDCHNYAGVNVFCWDCHIDPKEIQ